jgi:hypothetical protein
MYRQIYRYIHIHTHTQWSIIHYSPIKKNKIMPFAGKWVELDHHVKQNKPDSERQITHFSLILGIYISKKLT